MSGEQLVDQWRGQWQNALEAWGRFTRLTEPRWCLTEKEEKKEQLTGSFAMIRLTDHAVVISLRQVSELGLEKFAGEILAHEIGHHVLAPADLRDNARLMVRIRSGIPTCEQHAPMVANLYTDLLINDRLQRDAGLNMAGVYKVLRQKESPPLWALYMRIYELLWSLPRHTLTDDVSEKIEFDAGLGSRVVRVYAKNWLTGAGRFAALLLPYLLELPKSGSIMVALPPWLDSVGAGSGEEIPDGLAGLEDDELEGALHPSEDPAITGIEADTPIDSTLAEQTGGHKNRYRAPDAYRELMKGLGVKVTEKEVTMNYYRELAVPHLIRFPQRISPKSTDPQPEGLDSWEAGMPLYEIDWSESLVRSPQVIPGVTTVKRVTGESPGSSPKKQPLDLYIGIDCSGSMGNPAVSLSYPVLAATVITLSALRTGARVMACLSGEPGKFTQTDGFLRDERRILSVLTDYLGTGYSFGIKRLKDTILDGPLLPRPTHLLVVTDADIFYMLGEVREGWQITEQAAAKAGGGATFVLQIDRQNYQADIARLEACGWEVYTVNSQEELVAFATAFARAKYSQNGGKVQP
ncbi:MAG: hypothetical protein WCP10_02330 [Desulfuromonadales bacterium]